jgi:hypothetical protein
MHPAGLSGPWPYRALSWEDNGNWLWYLVFPLLLFIFYFFFFAVAKLRAVLARKAQQQAQHSGKDMEGGAAAGARGVDAEEAVDASKKLPVAASTKQV